MSGGLARAPALGRAGLFVRRLLGRPAAAIGCALALLVLLVAATAPLLFPDDPWAMKGQPFLWPGEDAEFPLGTDVLGRDIMSGIFHGARVSIAVGVSATLAALLIGTTIGAIAGYYGRWIDDLLMRGTEIVQTVPSFILILVLVALFAPSIPTIILAIGVSTWPPVARLVRGQFMALRGREFVQSCVVMGMGDLRIILTQVLPNAVAPMVAISSVMVATAILQESTLSFLGLGDPNVMSWGAMISTGRNNLRTAWYMAAIPGVMILLTVLSLNLVAEGLNDALNPRLKQR